MALHNILSQQLCCHFAFLTTGWSNRNSTMWMWSTIHSSYEVPPWWLTTAFSAVVIWMHLYKGPVRIHLSQANSWKKDMQAMSKKLWNVSPQHWGTQSSSPDNPKEEQAQLCNENKSHKSFTTSYNPRQPTIFHTCFVSPADLQLPAQLSSPSKVLRCFQALYAV